MLRFKFRYQAHSSAYQWITVHRSNIYARTRSTLNLSSYLVIAIEIIQDREITDIDIAGAR